MIDQNACANSILFYKAKPHKERYYCRMMSLWPLLFYNLLNSQIIRLHNKNESWYLSRCTWMTVDRSAYSEAFDSDACGARLSLWEPSDRDWTLDNEACLRDQPVTLEQNLISFKRPLRVVCDPISFTEREREGGKTAGECISILAVCGYGAVA